MSLTVELNSELSKLEPSAIIELFELDATALGGDLLLFHAGTNGLSQNVVWQGQTYVRYPIEITGFEFSGQGQFPRPKMSASNVLSAITQLLTSYDDLLGAKVTRKRTLAKFLDAVNFPGGVNPSADSTAEFSEDIYYIDRKSNEDRDVVEFELAASLDLIGVSLPRRQVIQNICIWKYRGAECGFAGAPLFDINDQRILNNSLTAYGLAVVNGYTAIQNAKTALATAEIVLSQAAQAMGPACEYQFISRNFSGNPEGPSLYHMTTGVSVTRNFSNQTQVTAMISGVQVALGAVYRQGPLVVQSFDDVFENPASFYYLDIWGINSSGCSTATTAYSNALTDRNNKKTALDTANANLAAAIAALPPTDPLYSLDRCGKRLSSCKLRFGDSAELPFGSFPAAGLVS